MRLAHLGSAALGVVLLLVPACSTEPSACRAVVDEPLDELSAQHVIAGASVQFDGVAPTSGPHLSIVGPGGIYDEPIEPLEQVTLLESGKVLIQYRPNEISLSDLQQFATDEVAVAPNPDLGAPISLTAWQARQECDAVDVATIRSFSSRFVGAPRNH